MIRVVTYDVKDGNSYDEFYELVEKYDATQLTESTYLFDTTLNQTDFVDALKKAFNKGDNVHYISVDKNNKLFENKVDIK